MTDFTPLPTLRLAFKPDADQSQRRMEAYWQGEILDRACVGIRRRRTGSNVPRRSLIVAEDFDLSGAIDQFEAWASQMFFGGESHARPDAQLRTRSVGRLSGGPSGLGPRAGHFLGRAAGARLGHAPRLGHRSRKPLVAGDRRVDRPGRPTLPGQVHPQHDRYPFQFGLSFRVARSRSGFAWTWSSGPRPCSAP